MKSKSVYIEILSLTNGLVILFLITGKTWLLYISVALAVTALLIPAFAVLLGSSLKKVIQALGMVTNTILLTIVYFLLLTPLAILYRIANKKKRKPSLESNSFFIKKEHTFQAEDFNNQW